MKTSSNNSTVSVHIDISANAQKLSEIAALCRRYDSAEVNVGAHALARKVLAIVEGQRT